MRSAGVALTLSVLLSGCGTGSSPVASGAAKDVRIRSENAGYAMAKAGRTSSAVDHARRVVGDTGTARIEALEAEGDGINGHVLLRISVSIEASGFASGSQATACFRYDFGDRDATQPHEVDCPNRPAMVLPEPTPEPTLPPDSQERLRRALAAADPESAARAAFSGTGVQVSTATKDGVVATAVRAGRGTCLFARRLTDRSVEVWVVPRVLAQPGELGCDVQFALTGAGKQSPH